MEIISQHILILILCHALFHWKFYRNPYVQSTSELIQNFFPHWHWLGRTKNVFKDDIFYKYPGCIPFLSTFYPFHYLTAKLSRFLSLDTSFILLNTTVLFHRLLLSIMSYMMFLQWYDPSVSLYGSILFTYAAYSFKIQQPAIAYTMAWIPACFIHGWVGIMGFGMCLLTGYYPLLIYMCPVIAILNPPALLGTFLGLPQLIPFLWYIGKSVPYRWSSRLKLSESMRLILPRDSVTTSNGVLTTETSCYIGIIPFLLMPHSFIFAAAFFILMAAFFNVRLLYIVTFIAVIGATHGISNLQPNLTYCLCLLQFYDLLRNNYLYPSFPFTEWWKKPSEFFKKPTAKYPKFPISTGYITKVQNKGYQGCLRMKTT